MRSRFPLVAICAVAALLVAAPATADDVHKGFINAGKTLKFSLATDVSTQLLLDLVGFHERSDLDILITTGTGDDTEILLDSKSAMRQVEKGAVGLIGAQDVTICISNASDVRTRYVLTITQLTGVDVMRGPAVAVGGFPVQGSVSSPQDAVLQRLVQRQQAAKGRVR